MDSRSGPVVRAALFVLLGIPVCTALLVAAIWVSVYAWSLGEPFGAGAWLYLLLFTGLPGVVLFFSFRAWRRSLRSEGERLRWLGRAVPILVGVGVGLGIAVSQPLTASQRETASSRDHRLCLKVLGHHGAPSRFDACGPIARACRRETSGEHTRPVPRGSAGPKPVPPALRCLRKRLSRR